MECEHGRNVILQAVPLCLSRLRDLLNGTSPMRKVCVGVCVGVGRGEERKAESSKEKHLEELPGPHMFTYITDALHTACCMF